ncbi:ABC transporter permease [Rubrolithibacter danxiaensis]|uniref:ABC transporter permease n=1 Tax=Rubrolithibacter danxiaensis TaxID=3390805 RepID=UPI003BF7E107
MAVKISHKENIKVALQSIKSNRLRTFLTALIIAIGLTALVGILTSIDAIKGSLNNTFSSMGSNSFTIRNRGLGIRVGGEGQQPKRFRPITYRESVEFKTRFNFPALVSVNVFASFAGTVKYGNEKTNPNISVLGADDNYLYTGGYKLAAGRNFSQGELELGSNVVIIGNEIKTTLFPNTDAIDKIISIGSNKFKIIGQYEAKGSSVGFGGDKVCVIPLLKAKQIMTINDPSYTISVMTNDPQRMDAAAGEATALFRNIRGLKAGIEDNFEITKSDALAQTLLENIKYITLAAIVIGFITLVGASIGLMNIMLVSVTERTREIGIRKAIGATPKVIRLQFLLEAIVICLIGGLTGIILGILIGNLVAMLLGASFMFPVGWVTLGTALCIGVGIISGFYPASKASRLDPVEALRYE